MKVEWESFKLVYEVIWVEFESYKVCYRVVGFFVVYIEKLVC